jgi:hypothetical protein
MSFRLLLVAYCAGLLLGGLSLIERLARWLVGLWLAGRFLWLEVRLVRIWRRIAR